jgi:hypothetical protein
MSNLWYYSNLMMDSGPVLNTNGSGIYTLTRYYTLFSSNSAIES